MQKLKYISDVLWLPESVCFNLDKQGPEFKKENFPLEIQAKYRKSDESFIARISDYNRENFRYNPYTVIADASHHTNAHNWYDWCFLHIHILFEPCTLGNYSPATVTMQGRKDVSSSALYLQQKASMDIYMDLGKLYIWHQHLRLVLVKLTYWNKSS